jgi:hypothetical protein
MEFTLTINCDNAAFEEHPPTEVARILRGLAERLEGLLIDAPFSGNLVDSNGNGVGGFEMAIAEECTAEHWSEDKYGNETRIDCGNGCEY